VSLLAIWGPIIVANFSKSLVDILLRSCKPPWSSSREFNTLLSRYLHLNIALCHHLRLCFFLVWQSIFIRIKAAPAIIICWSDITDRSLKFHFHQHNLTRGLWRKQEKFHTSHSATFPHQLFTNSCSSTAHLALTLRVDRFSILRGAHSVII
jgi:hypothetical protein